MSHDKGCEAITAVFSWGATRCGQRATGEAIDATWGTIHAVCDEHTPGWTHCDRNCDPAIPEATTPDASHFLDCPVWAAILGKGH